MQIVLQCCSFREDVGRWKGEEPRLALCYYSSGLLERECRPVMICAMMMCSTEVDSASERVSGADRCCVGSRSMQS